MTLSFETWVSDRIDEERIDGYARQRAEEELLSDPTLEALWRASYAADDRQSGLQTQRDEEAVEGVIDALVASRRACDDALEILADRVLWETITDVEIGDHVVDLWRSTWIDCPHCEESFKAYYVGHSGDSVAWVCGHCETTLLEDSETGEITEADA